MTSARAIARLRAKGLSERDATVVVEHLAEADRMGRPGHGLTRIDWLEGLLGDTIDPGGRPQRVERSDGFERVDWPDDRRAGVLGLASVLAMTSHYKHPSPVLRGAWVLEKLLGTPVPPPPPDVPALPEAKKGETLPMREALAAHRESTACSACHNLMDPIGLGLENFDWMGRWRDVHADGRPVDATGSLPTGETFDGPAELRAVLVKRKKEFLRQIVTKVLGYAVGRGRQDGDQCTIEEIVAKLEANGYAGRTLIREVVLSAPFRNLQSDVQVREISQPVERRPRRLLGTK